MGKKRYNSRQNTSVETRKCVEDVKLPAINPTVNVTEGKIKMRKKPRRQSKEKDQAEEIIITNDRIVELFEIQMKEKSAGCKSSNEDANSLDTAMEMLHEKEKKRGANKVGAELENIKDRMINVVILHFLFVFFISLLLLPSTVICYISSPST